MSDLQDCRLCPRLTAYRKQLKAIYPDYHCLPVAGFGDATARLLIVGLAPGLHGANATGRPFTGDASGTMLFQTLHRHGFSNQATSRASNDNLRLLECRVTNVVKCVPPQNRPNAEEITRCNYYLQTEITRLYPGSLILALGSIAHRGVLKALQLPMSRFKFSHLAEHRLSSQLHMIDSYHCSRYNINTGRLNQTMFDKVFRRAKQILQ